VFLLFRFLAGEPRFIAGGAQRVALVHRSFESVRAIPRHPSRSASARENPANGVFHATLDRFASDGGPSTARRQKRAGKADRGLVADIGKEGGRRAQSAAPAPRCRRESQKAKVKQSRSPIGVNDSGRRQKHPGSWGSGVLWQHRRSVAAPRLVRGRRFGQKVLHLVTSRRVGTNGDNTQQSSRKPKGGVKRLKIRKGRASVGSGSAMDRRGQRALKGPVSPGTLHVQARGSKWPVQTASFGSPSPRRRGFRFKEGCSAGIGSLRARPDQNVSQARRCFDAGAVASRRAALSAPARASFRGPRPIAARSRKRATHPGGSPSRLTSLSGMDARRENRQGGGSDVPRRAPRPMAAAE